jgi:diguanylate cyclase (GGDEF)-like protein
MERRLRPLRTWSFVVLAVGLLISGPWVGWWTLLPLAAAGIVFALTGHALERSPRPEYRMAAAWLGAELAIAVSVALTGGPRSPAVDWLVLPIVTLGARFDARGIAAGASIAAILILATTLGVHPGYVIGHPQQLVFPLALLGALTLLSMALMRSDLQHRSASVIDPLTSMLNRNALRTRIGELRHQARVVRQPIGIIIGDLDHFKHVNDVHGHAAGDGVLQDVAYRVRKQLRAFDLAYRLGGEEFLVLLPGAGPREATAVAESLRAAIAAGPHGPMSVTMSFGVSASVAGSFDYEQVFAAADQALYLAKAAGRNCVRRAGEAAESAAGEVEEPPGRSRSAQALAH